MPSPEDPSGPTGQTSRRVSIDLRWGRAGNGPTPSQQFDPNVAYVFVSSTFQDMHAERDHLSRIVFPKLRLIAALYGVHVLEIDLRAGVTEWIMASPEDALRVCQRQIDRCRPFFICILGERYGSVLPSVDRSITDLEIQHAVDGAAGGLGVSFFLRSPSALTDIPEIRKSDFVESDPAVAQRVERLKHFIRHELAPMVAYDGYPARWDASAIDWASGRPGRLVDLDSFGRTVGEVVWSHLKNRLGLPSRPPQEADPASREQAEQQRAFMINSSNTEDLRRPINAQLEASLGSGRPTVLIGEPGSGKTSTLLSFCNVLAKGHGNVLFHFVGACQQSKSLPHTLWRVCRNIEQLFGIDVITGLDAPSLAVSLRQGLHRIPKDMRFVLVLDGIDEFEDEESILPEMWWPDWMPPHVSLVASCSADDVGRLGGQNAALVHLMPLDLGARSELLEVLSPLLPGKMLGRDVEDMLLSCNAAGNPLFLKLAYSFIWPAATVARTSHGQTGRDELLTRSRHAAAIGRSAASSAIELIIEAIFAEAENYFEPDLLRNLLALLASARWRLQESEIDGILRFIHPSGDALLPALFFLRAYLPRRWGHVEPIHRAVIAAAVRRYSPSPELLSANHALLAKFFLAGANAVSPEPGESYVIPNYRKLEELPWQLFKAQMHHELRVLTSDPDWRDIRQRSLGPIAAREDLVWAARLAS